MANRKSWAAMLIMALVLATAASCGKGSTGGRFTITGIPPEYNGKYVMLTGLGESFILGFQDHDGAKITFSRISNGKISIPLWKDKDGGVDVENVQRYFGNDTALGIAVNIYDSEDGKESPVATVGFLSVKFSNGNAAKAWGDGTLVVLDRQMNFR